MKLITKLVILSPLLLLVALSFAQGNLCQGAHWTDEEGSQMMHLFSEKWDDKASWENRSSIIKQGIVTGLGWDKVPDLNQVDRVTIRGTKEMDGYVVENIAIESFPGFFVTGNLYRPIASEGKSPGILCPHGHWSQPGDVGRFRADMQIRCAMLARMGCVVIAYDMVGYGESTQIDHKMPIALLLQTWNSKRVVDYLVSRPDVDTDRIAITGASGGGTQTFISTALDDRIDVSIPAVMVSAHFFGGCVCESGMPIHKSNKHQTNNVEIAALAAPRPMLILSDGGDWTANNPIVEIPYLRRVYKAYGVEPRLHHVHFPLERHDYGRHKRAALYNFLGNEFDLPISRDLYDHQENRFNEHLVTIQEEQSLYVFDGEHSRPSEALLGNEAVTKYFLEDYCR
ncbi:MAG: acetylxylan esterase [Saprospiraceae bacterium]|nr:acetylxylan esterase [Saprospiraceae bacterium]